MIDALGNPQSVLLAGGTSEIGLAIVEAIASSRLERVALAGRDPAALQVAGGALSTPGRTVTTHALDVEVQSEHDAVLDAVFAAGDVDVAVMAIGILGDQVLEEQDADRAAHVMKVNSTDSAALTHRIFLRLAAQGHGTLVVLSSIAAVRPRRANFVYGASKAGLDAFTQGLIELGREQGVDVILVRPGFVRTRMTTGLPEAPFTVDPKDVGSDVAAALRKHRSIVYSPAAVGGVAAALRVMPRPLLRKLPR